MAEKKPVTWTPVELSAAIGQVREQLEDAIKTGASSSIAFRPGPVELELEVAFSASGEGEIGVKAWVLSAGVKGDISHSRTNTLKVTLTPITRDGGDLMIGSVGDR